MENGMDDRKGYACTCTCTCKHTHTHTHTHTCGKLACLAPLSRLRRRSQEILFCVEKGLFGLPCTDVYQTIDADQGTLGNVIEFTDQGFLKVL